MITEPATLEKEIQAFLPGEFSRVRIAPRRSPYSTSSPIYDVSACEGDVRRELVLKLLSREVLLPEARRAKPTLVYEPSREVGMYRHLLVSRWGTPRLVASRLDASQGSWLLLEKVRGRELFQVGELSHWARAVRWIARFHRQNRTAVAADLPFIPFLVRDEAFYWQWMDRALRFCPDARLALVAERFSLVVERMLAQPHTLVHGEFYASNVIVTEDRICPIDWEMAGFGPALLDLAALGSGRGWTSAQRSELARAYLEEAPSDNVTLDLEACRAALAIQWLGWAPRWQPPGERAQDWLAEALRATGALAGSR